MFMLILSNYNYSTTALEYSNSKFLINMKILGYKNNVFFEPFLYFSCGLNFSP